MCGVLRTDMDIKKIEIETLILIENLIENVDRNNSR